jgi:MFS family permease
MRAGAAVGSTTGTNRTIAIGAGGLAVLLGALDTYVVITIIRDIMTDVGIPLNQLQRVAPIITGYLVGYIAAMPLLGRASDRFGRKLLIQVGLAGFAIGSVVTALSTDLTMLVIGRIIQGSASGALLPVTLALAADLWAEHKRAAVLGGIGAAQELGSVLGPLYGIGLVALFAHWQAVFWVNIPLALLAMVMIHFSVPGKQESQAPPIKVDVVGGVLLAVVLILVVFGLYNPEPSAREVVPTWRLWLLAGAARDLHRILRLGAVRQDQADRPRRGAVHPLPGRAGRVVRRRCGADGHAGERRTVRPGRVVAGPEPGRLPADALSGGAADRRRPGRVAGHPLR